MRSHTPEYKSVNKNTNKNDRQIWRNSTIPISFWSESEKEGYFFLCSRLNQIDSNLCSALQNSKLHVASNGYIQKPSKPGQTLNQKEMKHEKKRQTNQTTI